MSFDYLRKTYGVPAKRGGHELIEENVYINPRGHRECRTCRGEAAQRQKEKRATNARNQ